MVRRVELVIRKKTVDSTTGMIYARSANTKLRQHPAPEIGIEKLEVRVAYGN